MTDLEMDLVLAQARIKQLEKELTEATSMNPKLKTALETISEHCKKQDCCEGCYFFILEKDACFFSFSDLPCDWGGDLSG